MESRIMKCLSRIALAFLMVVILTSFRPQTLAKPFPSFSPEKATFAVRFKGIISPYRVLGVFVLPGETVTLEAIGAGEQNPYVLLTSTSPTTWKKSRDHFYVVQASAGKVRQLALNQWQWVAPKTPGMYPVKIRQQRLEETITLHMFVLVPFSRVQTGYLNGYRIGSYPVAAYKGLPIYHPPRGFIEVTEKNQDTLVTPHFTLKQFLCKQKGGYPKYIVLREELLVQLELILERVNAKGYRADTFAIMSGYRTPFYNQAIGNGKYSRHQWGDAADIFIDEFPKDGIMDDLNGDGLINYADALLLYRLIDEFQEEHFEDHFTDFTVGGLGWYEKNTYRGPFVHVDVRGFPARWGDCKRVLRLGGRDKNLRGMCN